ncbi:MAG: ABC transporter ATP-binding protein [Candidatus Hydrogenedentales bacterium]|jgi:ABC-2 type transport system ATP-binding protein
MLAIRTQQLSKSFKSIGKKTVHALRPMDLAVEQGEIFGFLGRNGAGKTTAIKMLTGLIHPSNGDAFLFDSPTNQPDARKQVGYMPEHPYFYEYLTPRETLDFYGSLRGLTREARLQEWDTISKLLDLQDIGDRRIRSFSKGMRQRVGFAVALVGDPPLLILDEPMSGLDPLGRKMIRELMLRLNHMGKTIFFSSHVLSDVEEICDRVGILVSGKLTACDRIVNLVDTHRQSVELEVAGINADALEPVSGVALQCLFNKDGSCRLTFSDSSHANDAIKAIQNLGGQVLSLHPAVESLEDFFMRIQDVVDVPDKKNNEESEMQAGEDQI